MNRMSRSAMLMVIGLYLLGHGVLADDLIISEVAWGGTLGSVNDEWIELRNTTDQPIDLAGWVLTFNNAQIPLGEVGENAIEVRTAVLAPGAFYLMERTDDNAVADVRADLLYYKALSNTGDRIELRNPDGVVVDFVGESLGVAWPAGSAGSGEPPCVTMERTGTGEWVSNNGVICNGVDKDGNPLNGTPGQPNSVDVIADLAPTTVATASAGALVISEVAWAGTAASSNDEWIELHNQGDVAIDLAGWHVAFGDVLILLGEEGEDTLLVRTAVLPAGAFLLLERTDDNAVSDIPADIIYKGAMLNGGVLVELVNPQGDVVDLVPLLESGWLAGTGPVADLPYCSMERTSDGGWVSNNGIIRNGLDVDGNPINGTPGQPHST